ncbi:MAG: CcmD family protein [Coriobacteriia bacterium]|nr:CcmD family protein [Coriobacteriia bacterium]
MDPVLKEIYSLVLPAAPYVLAAYGILWIGLFGYVTVVLRRLGKIEAELRIVEEALARRA